MFFPTHSTQLAIKPGWILGFTLNRLKKIKKMGEKIKIEKIIIKGSSHVSTFPLSIFNFPPSLFLFFLLFFSNLSIFLSFFFLASLFPVGQQTFPGEKVSRGTLPLAPPPGCYTTGYYSSLHGFPSLHWVLILVMLMTDHHPHLKGQRYIASVCHIISLIEFRKPFTQSKCIN